jgi:hypothetical protein
MARIKFGKVCRPQSYLQNFCEKRLDITPESEYLKHMFSTAFLM